MQILNIKYSQLTGPDNKSRGIHSHAPIAIGKEFLHQLVLSLLQALHSERHATQVGYLLLGVAQGQMTKKALVVLIDLIIDNSLLLHELTAYAPLEALHNTL